MDKISDDQIRETFKLVGEGKISKEAVAEIISWVSKEDKTIQDAIKELGMQSISRDELARVVTKIVEENKHLVKTRGEDSFGALMGIAMKTLRGKADAALMSKILKEKVKEAMN